jgi:hypothetical protein
MLTSDLHPPRSGPNADPILYGVAAALAALFPPPASGHARSPEDAEAASDREAEREAPAD